jgi:hypothetical protein
MSWNKLPLLIKIDILLYCPILNFKDYVSFTSQSFLYPCEDKDSWFYTGAIRPKEISNGTSRTSIISPNSIDLQQRFLFKTYEIWNLSYILSKPIGRRNPMANALQSNWWKIRMPCWYYEGSIYCTRHEQVERMYDTGCIQVNVKRNTKNTISKTLSLLGYTQKPKNINTGLKRFNRGTDSYFSSVEEAIRRKGKGIIDFNQFTNTHLKTEKEEIVPVSWRFSIVKKEIEIRYNNSSSLFSDLVDHRHFGIENRILHIPENRLENDYLYI